VSVHTLYWTIFSILHNTIDANTRISQTRILTQTPSTLTYCWVGCTIHTIVGKAASIGAVGLIQNIIFATVDIILTFGILQTPHTIRFRASITACIACTTLDVCIDVQSKNVRLARYVAWWNNEVYRYNRRTRGNFSNIHIESSPYITRHNNIPSHVYQSHRTIRESCETHILSQRGPSRSIRFRPALTGASAFRWIFITHLSSFTATTPNCGTNRKLNVIRATWSKIVIVVFFAIKSTSHELRRTPRDKRGSGHFCGRLTFVLGNIEAQH